MAAEVEDRRGTLETEGLVLLAAVHLAVLVVAQEQLLGAAVVLEALPGIRGILGWIGGEDPIDELARDGPALGRQGGDLHAREHALASLVLDIGLDGRGLLKRQLLLLGAKASEQPLCDLELETIEVAWDPLERIPSLIAVHQRPTERGPFAAASSEPEVEVSAREDELVGRRPRVAAEQHMHRMDTGPVGVELVGDSLPHGAINTGLERNGACPCSNSPFADCPRRTPMVSRR